MPITQDRLAALLIEHEKHIAATKRLCANLARVLDSTYIQPSEKIDMLSAELLLFEHYEPVRAILERDHLNRSARRNMREREKATRVRRAHGVQPRMTTHIMLDDLDRPRYDDLASAAHAQGSTVHAPASSAYSTFHFDEDAARRALAKGPPAVNERDIWGADHVPAEHAPTPLAAAEHDPPPSNDPLSTPQMQEFLAREKERERALTTMLDPFADDTAADAGDVPTSVEDDCNNS